MRVAAAAVLAIAVAAGCDDGVGIDEIAYRAQQVRELRLLDNVNIVRLSRDEFTAQEVARVNRISDAYFVQLHETYGRLGFFGADLDLRPIVASSSSDWVGASYWNGQITLVGDVDAQSVVHEYVHALQDQNFGLADYDLPTSDGFLAHRAVVEGDATVAEYRFAVQDRDGVDLDQLNWPLVFSSYAEFSTNVIADADYPAFFLDYPSFVYYRGLAYCGENLTGVTVESPTPTRPFPYDWGREDELFTDRPPEHAANILWHDDDVVDLTRFQMPDEVGGRLELDNWDVLGEWYVYLLLYALGPDDAAAIASRWDGDFAMFLHDVHTDTRATLWVSEWDDEATADQVVAALWAIYGRVPLKGDPPQVARAGDGELAWVERRGTRVVAAKNLDLAVAGWMVEAAFAPAPARRARQLPRTMPPIALLLRGDGVF